VAKLKADCRPKGLASAFANFNVQTDHGKFEAVQKVLESFKRSHEEGQTFVQQYASVNNRIAANLDALDATDTFDAPDAPDAPDTPEDLACSTEAVAVANAAPVEVVAADVIGVVADVVNLVIDVSETEEQVLGHQNRRTLIILDDNEEEDPRRVIQRLNDLTAEWEQKLFQQKLLEIEHTARQTRLHKAKPKPKPTERSSNSY